MPDKIVVNASLCITFENGNNCQRAMGMNNMSNLFYILVLIIYLLFFSTH